MGTHIQSSQHNGPEELRSVERTTDTEIVVAIPTYDEEIAIGSVVLLNGNESATSTVIGGFTTISNDGDQTCRPSSVNRLRNEPIK